MRILILSDLHSEVWREATREVQQALAAIQPKLEVSQPDVVILAGDIDLGDRAVRWADQAFPNLPVIYVPGNHEAYGQNTDTLKRKLATACSATGHVHLLDKDEIVIGDVRFLGATLWTDFQLLGPETIQDAMRSAAMAMNDYRRIRLAKAGYRKIKPLDVAQRHWEDRIWLGQRLAEPFGGPTVVVTHMGPSPRSIPERYKGQILSAAFASDLEDLLPKADLWVHGHIHDSSDYCVGNTRVICNPLGYPERNTGGQWIPENADFDPHLVVEIGGSSPARQILLDAVVARARLVADWLSAAEVDALLAGQPGEASKLRRAGQVLGVYVGHSTPCYRYPPWQFGSDGLPVECRWLGSCSYCATRATLRVSLTDCDARPVGLRLNGSSLRINFSTLPRLLRCWLLTRIACWVRLGSSFLTTANRSIPRFNQLLHNATGRSCHYVLGCVCLGTDWPSVGAGHGH